MRWQITVVSFLLYLLDEECNKKIFSNKNLNLFLECFDLERSSIGDSFVKKKSFCLYLFLCLFTYVVRYFETESFYVVLAYLEIIKFCLLPLECQDSRYVLPHIVLNLLRGESIGMYSWDGCIRDFTIQPQRNDIAICINILKCYK